MMGRTHVLLGINSLWMLEISGQAWPQGQGTDSSAFTVCVLLASLGALIPDLDATSSLLQNVSVGGVRPLVLPAQVLRRQFGHRGALHSLLALAIVACLSSPLLRLGIMAWLSLLLGFLSHLLGDASTKRGVPLFYPRRDAVHLLPKLLRLSTGSLAEELIFVVFSAGAMSLLLSHLGTVAPL